MRLALLLLLLPSIAQAATAIVYSPEQGEEAVRQAWMQQRGHDDGVRFVSVDAVFDPTAPAIVLGDATAVPCERELGGVEEFGRLNDAVFDLVLDQDYLPAVGALAKVEALLPCLSEVPSADVMAGFHFMRGLVAYYASGPDAATSRFEEALLVSPFLQWDTTWPPVVKPTFDAAVAGALQAKSALLSLSPSMVEAGSFWLDGRSVDARTRTSTLYEGTHVLQWRPEGGSVTSWVVEVDAGHFVTVVHRGDAVASLLSGHADPGVTAFARAQVLAPVEQQAGATLVVAEPWEVTLFHRQDPLSGRWELADLDAIERWRQSGRRMRNTGIGMILGGIGAAGIGIATVAGGVEQAWEIEDDLFDEDGYGFLSDLTLLQPAYARAQAQVRVGWTLSFVGAAVSLAGIPVGIVGEQRTRATGLHQVRPTKRRKAKKAP